MQAMSTRVLRLLLVLATAALFAACRAPAHPTASTPIGRGALSTVAPTRPPLPTPTVAVVAAATATPGVATTKPLPAPTQPPPTPAEQTAALPNSTTVVYVTADDTLAVRRTPGVDGALVGTLAPGTRGVQITGGSLQVDGSSWAPVLTDTLQGWVNSTYLTTTLDGTAFCEDPAVLELLRRLESAVGARNNQLLSQITHPERGLRVRTNWWNPEVRITGAELATLFGNPTDHAWGIADGSGLPINGSFTDVILPLLDKDFTGATTTACRRLPAGPTAGIVTLPAEYEGTAYVGYHRAANDELSFDWGTWAVGIEQWQGKYVIAYLVHYAYEI